MPVVRSGASNSNSSAFQPNAGHSFLLLAIVVLCYLFFILLIRAYQRSLEPLPQMYLIGIFGAELLAIGLPVWLFARLNRFDLSKTFPFRMISGRVILLTVLITLSGFVMLSQINLFLAPLSKMYEKNIMDMQNHMVSAVQYNATLFIIGVTLIPAVCEEFLFRGIIFSGIQNSAGKVWALVVSSILFGLMHFILPQIILMTLFGLLLGVLFILTGSLIVPIMAHLINNIVAICGILNIKSIPWLDESQAYVPLPILLPSIGLFIVGLYLLIRNRNT